jgi:phosphatidate cytidylyltransferase
VLRWRLAGAFAIIAPALIIFWLDAVANAGRPGIWLLVIAVVFAIGACGELHQIFRAVGGNIWIGPTLGSVALTFVIGTFPVWWRPHASSPPDAAGISGWGWVAIGLSMALGFRFCAAMRNFTPRPQALTDLTASFFTIVYVALPLLFLLQTRVLWQSALGLWAVGSIVWVVKMSDAGAYFCGRLLGRHKLAPRLSPKKTVEGALGGFVVAVLSSVAFFWTVNYLFPEGTSEKGPVREGSIHETSFLAMASYGLAIAVAGMLGDLAESLVKRHAGMKDSASWIPGLGGTLDVFDSIQFAAPIGYIFWATGIVGGLR